MKKLLFYSKFVFDTPETPPRAPETPSVGAGIERRQEKATQHVEQTKQAAEALKKKKDDLFKMWQENDPKGKIEVVEDDPKMVVFSDIKDPTRAKEAYLLMSLIENFWPDEGGINKAMTLYKEAKGSRKKANDIDFTPFEHFFRKGEHSGSSTERLGFYFWKEKNKWYTYDKDPKSDDEPMGDTYLLKCIDNIGKEFADPKNKDSGLAEEDEKKVLEFLKKSKQEGDKYNDEKYKGKGKEIVKWFQSKATDKWASLDKDTARVMNVLFGAGVGKYLYRYSPDQKKIYFIKLQSASVDSSEGVSGYIDVKEEGLGEWKWHTDVNELKKQLLDSMGADKVGQELLDEKTKAGEAVKEDEAIEATKKLLVEVHGIQKPNYSKLGSDYVNEIEKKLKEKLKEKGYDEAKAENVARISATELKRKVEKKINDSPELKKATSESDPALEISLDNNAEPNVNFADVKEKNDWKDKLAKAKEESEGSALDKIIDQKTEDITKKLGPLGFILKFFKIDIKSDVTEYFKTGKKSIFLSIAGAISGVEIGRRVFAGKGIDKPEDLKKLAEENGGVLKADHEFKKDVTISGYKITIPKGKGIKPGKDFKASGVEIKTEEEKKAEKPKFSFLSLFSSKSKKEFVMEDTEIVIAPGDTVPEKTVIPKEAKIEKVA